MKRKLKRVAELILLVTMILIIAAASFGCASLQRAGKSIESELNGGLNRVVTVYNANGEVLKTYEGKIDMAPTEGGIVKFDLNGQRIMYYNCYVEVIEKIN